VPGDTEMGGGERSASFGLESVGRMEGEGEGEGGPSQSVAHWEAQ